MKNLFRHHSSTKNLTKLITFFIIFNRRTSTPSIIIFNRRRTYKSLKNSESGSTRCELLRF
ncbi:hypothetical protein Hanom_Chr03g00234021 [Helianthus anomalus]